MVYTVFEFGVVAGDPRHDHLPLSRYKRGRKPLAKVMHGKLQLL